MLKRTSPAKKRPYRRQPPDIAYTITLPNGHKLEIKKSANAWWMNEQTTREMISAFRLDSTIAEACAYAGITQRQYKYFVQIHPEFPEIREGFQHLLTLKARQTVLKGLDDFKTAMWFLRKKKPEEFGPRSGTKRFVKDPNFKPNIVVYEKLAMEREVRERSEKTFREQQDQHKRKYKTRDESGTPEPFTTKVLKTPETWQ